MQEKHLQEGLMKRHKKIKISSILTYVILTAALIFTAFPFYWMVVSSLNKPGSLFAFPPKLIPDFYFKNYITMWHTAPGGYSWWRFIWNTVFIATTTTALSVFNSTLAGFAFAKIKFPLRDKIFLFLLGLMMIPGEMLLIPNYVILKHLNWLNTYQAMIVPWGASVFGIFLARQSFKTLPNELWEAAQVDGCSIWRYLFSIAVPLAKPTLLTLALFVFLGSWNSFLWPLIVARSYAIMPLEVALRSFIGAEGTDWGPLTAASTMATVPVLIVFLIFQQQFIEGISKGALKG